MPVRRSVLALLTGFAFAVFAAGALVIGGAALPALRWLSRNRDTRERRSQYLIHLAFRIFVRLVTALGLIRVSVVGRERLRGRPAALVIANHPTLIDVVLLVAAMPQADCVVKPGVSRSRFFGGVAAGAGYVPSSEGPELIDACVGRLRAGRWLLLFPEGTRSPVGRLGPFRRGAAHIALRAACDIVPVVITCDPPLLVKTQPWYRVPDRTAHLTLIVGERFRPSAWPPVEGLVLAARAWTVELRAFYEARL